MPHGSFPPSLLTALCAGWLGLSSCVNTIAPTEVVVEIDADSQVSALLSALRIEVWSAGEDPDCGRPECWTQRLGRDFSVASQTWPVRFPVLPLQGDDTRVFEVIAQALDKGGNVLVEQRAVSSFVPGGSARIALTLDDLCIEQENECAANSGCHGPLCNVCRRGACEPTGLLSPTPSGELAVAPLDATTENVNRGTNARDAGSGPSSSAPSGTVSDDASTSSTSVRDASAGQLDAGSNPLDAASAPSEAGSPAQETTAAASEAGEADQCPNDPAKTQPGVCGCGTPDRDGDGDGTFDCADGCPDDARKVAPARCGCGRPETDRDQDRIPDCVDTCADDPTKSEPLSCGCGVAERDGDGDRTADCRDGCPADANKTSAGVCGCGMATCTTSARRLDFAGLTLITFSGVASPQQLDTYYPEGLTLQGATFRPSNDYLYLRQENGAAFLYGAVVDERGRAALTITLPADTRRVGFDLATVHDDAAATVQIALSTGDRFSVPGTRRFFGVTSATAIAGIEITVTGPAMMGETVLIDDFTFGR